jgi:hypothetical protein
VAARPGSPFHTTASAPMRSPSAVTTPVIARAEVMSPVTAVP